MQSEIMLFRDYLAETLDVSVNPVCWDYSEKLPLFLKKFYAFFQVKLLEAPCLLMVDRGGKEHSPATIQKHMTKVREKWNGEVVYIREGITTYNRKRLVEYKLPFVVPGNQMYLPMLGIDLRNHLKKLQTKTKKFSPSTQALIIHVLLKNSRPECTPSEMAPLLGYTPMTMTRAFDELENANVGIFSLKGRERCLAFSQKCQGKDFWEKALPFMRTPIKKQVIIAPQDIGQPRLRAGLSALACYSMLAEPHNPAFALSRKRWKLLKQDNQITELSALEPGALEIEIWSYDPCLFATNNVVDHLSLYLSLMKSQDERIAAALEEMMMRLKW